MCAIYSPNGNIPKLGCDVYNVGAGVLILVFPEQTFRILVPAGPTDVKDVFFALRDLAAELNGSVATLKLQVSPFFFPL